MFTFVFVLLLIAILLPVFFDFVDEAHEHASHLLPFIDIEEVDQKRQQWALEVKAEIEVISRELLDEQVILNELFNERQAAKSHFMWFFDTPSRLRVEETEKKIRLHEGKLDALLDDVQLRYSQLKPLLTIHSQAFFMELVQSYLTVLDELTFLLIPSLGLTVFSLLLLGPFFFTVWLMWSFIGLSVLPILFSLLSCYWLTVKVPWIIISYSPPPLEFFAVYGAVCLFILLQTVLLFKFTKLN